MDVVMLSRLQFAVAVFFHFIFVPLTLGLSVLLAIMETIYVRTGNEQYKRMAKFWGKLFLINFALGVVTGITLEFQFGTNWSRYSEFVGDVFGPLLAIEATVAFFLESTFIAVWHFGWDKVSKRVHLFAIWAVAVAGNLSAVWIILANGWMQNPVGFDIVNGRAVLDGIEGFLAAVSNSFAWSQFFHTIIASWMLGGFFVLGVSAWHLRRGGNVDFFRKSFKLAAGFTAVLAIVLAVQGHQHGMEVAKTQPAKLAAMESHWETTEGGTPLYLLVWPDEANKKNLFEAIPLPGMLSFLAYADFNKPVPGLKDAAAADFAAFVDMWRDAAKKAEGSPAGEKISAMLAEFEKGQVSGATAPGHEPVVIAKEDALPPVLLTFLSFRFMAGMAVVFILLGIGAWLYRERIEEKPLLARLLTWAIPLPYLAIMAGWMLAEVGRQPWIVHKVMMTHQAVSPVPAGNVGLSLAAFIAVYTLLGVIDIYLLQKYAKKGPAA